MSEVENESTQTVHEIETDEFDLDQMRLKVLVFTLSNEDYAIDLAEAKEVLELSRLTKIPYTPGFVRGAMNLRGEIITVIDIRELAGIPTQKANGEIKVIVTDVTGNPIGILADTVKGTIDIPKADIQPPLLTIAERSQRHIKGQVKLGDEILILLDLRKILLSEAMNQLREAKATG